jgi:hypothetical protein
MSELEKNASVAKVGRLNRDLDALIFGQGRLAQVGKLMGLAGYNPTDGGLDNEDLYASFLIDYHSKRPPG